MAGAQRPVRAVIFDYGGVLSTSPFSQLPLVDARLGLPPGTIGGLLGYALDAPEPAPGEPYTNPWHRLEVGEIDLGTFLGHVERRAAEVLPPDSPFDLGRALGEMNAVVALGVHWMMIRRARELAAGGYRLAICTNNVREFASSWRAAVPVELFDVVVDSCEVGLRKPDPRIYELTCDRLGIEPVEAVFLDDHPTNLGAAERLGMRVVHVGEDPWEALDRLDEVLGVAGR